MVKSRKEKEWEKVLREAEQWTEDFKQSSFFEDFDSIDEEDVDYIIAIFVGAAYEFEEHRPKKWTKDTLKACCIDLFPEIIAEDEAFFENMPFILKDFFFFLEEEGHIQNGIELGDEIMDMVDDILQKSQDKSNWDIGKIYTMYAMKRVEQILENLPSEGDDIRVAQLRMTELMIHTYVLEEVKGKGRDPEEVIDELPSSEFLYYLGSIFTEEDWKEFSDKQVAEDVNTQLVEAVKEGRNFGDLIKGFSPAQELLAFYGLKMLMEQSNQDFDELVNLRPEENPPKYRTKKAPTFEFGQPSKSKTKRRKKQKKEPTKLSSKSARIVPMYQNAPPKVGRNAPCPCGSGKKYKRCCGQ